MALDMNVSKWIQSRSIQMKGYGHCAASACSACTQVGYWKGKSHFFKGSHRIHGPCMVYLPSENYLLQLVNIHETGVDDSWISWFPGFMNRSGNGALSLKTWIYVVNAKRNQHYMGAVSEMPPQRNMTCFPDKHDNKNGWGVGGAACHGESQNTTAGSMIGGRKSHRNLPKKNRNVL